MRVLIGYDGSEHSDAIFDDLKRAGLPRDAEAKVLTVADLLLTGPPVSEVATELATSFRVASALDGAVAHGEHVRKEAAGFASSAAARLRSLFPEWNVTSEVTIGTPGWELLDAAKNWRADLVVVGSQGRSALGRLFLGSVSKRVATDAESSVRVVRPSGRENEHAPPVIVVGIDGSPAAEAAVKEVGRRVWPANTRIHLVAASDIPSPAGIAAVLPQAAGMIGEFGRTMKNRAETMLDWAGEQLGSIGLEVSNSVRKAEPKRLLLEEAGRVNADTIFVGTRDFKDAFDRFRLGSVSTAVVTDSAVTVEVVRRADDPGETTGVEGQG